MWARENPFAAGRLHALQFRLPGIGWTTLEQRWIELGRRAAIVGPEGPGKTTLLEAWRRCFEAAGWRVRCWQLTRQHRHPDRLDRSNFWSRPAAEELVLLDGAEQLPPWRWQAWLYRMRSAGGLLITSHRPGRLPTLIECRTTPELLDELVATLLGGLSPAIQRLNRLWFRRHQGNLRLVLRAWYDLCARRPLHPLDPVGRFPGGAEKTVLGAKMLDSEDPMA